MMPMPERPVIDQSAEPRPLVPAHWRSFVESTLREQFALGVAICWKQRHAHVALGFWVIGIERVALEPVAAEPLE